MKHLVWLSLLSSSAWAAPRDLLIVPDDTDRFSRGAASAVSDAPWWLAFGDDGLTSVIEAGITANPDVASADARIAQAQGAAWQSRSAFLPSITADATGSMAPQKSLGFQFGGLGGPEPEGLYYSYGVGIGVQLPVDLFGRAWLAYRAATHDVDAAELDRSRFVMTLSAALGGAYFDVVSARRQEAVALEQMAIATSLLEVVELRYDHASVSGLDVLQQRSQAANAEVFVSQAVLGRELAEQRLAVLLARAPRETVPGVASNFSELPGQPAVGTPAQLLARRTDLVAAEERLTASSQRHHSAYSGLLPSLTLQADAGRDWIDIDEVRTQDAWSAGGSFRVPLFNGGRAHGAMRVARAAEYGSAASYGRLILQAQGEVEGALSQEAAMVERLDAVGRQATLARLTFEQSRERYLLGLDAFINVLLAQTTLRQAEQSLVTAQRDVLSARLALHTALGGSWADTYAFEMDGDNR